MTISNALDNLRTFTGDGTTTAFPLTFTFKRPEDVFARIRTATDRPLVLGADYTISGDTVGGQGVLNMLTAPATGERLLVSRATPGRQDQALSQTAAFPSQEVEANLDDMARQVGDVQTLAGRAFIVDIEEEGPVEVPIATLRAEQIMGFDEQGDFRLYTQEGFRGPPGTINATGPLADRTLYDNESPPFAFLATDQNPPLLFFRETATPGVWSPGIPFSFGTGTNFMDRAFGNAVQRLPNSLLDPSIFSRGIPMGHVLWWPYPELLPGTLRANGETIGRAGSGAQHEDDAFREAFDRLKTWPNTPNSGSEDFDQGHLVTLPRLQGLGLGGADVMGGTAANILQFATTIDTTLNANTATVADVTGICIGMYVVSANVPAGTTITDISRTGGTQATLTLSNNATATAVGTAANISLFQDADGLGQVAGTTTHQLHSKEAPTHAHPPTPTGGTPRFLVHRNAGGSRQLDDPGNDITPGDADDALTGEAGEDLAHPTQQPTMLGQWIVFMKPAAGQVPTAFGIDGRYYLFNADASATPSDPGAGKFRLNAAFGSATRAFIDNLDANGHDISGFLASWSIGYMQLVNITSPGGFALYDLTANAVDRTGYYDMALQHRVSSAAFNADDSLAVLYVPGGPVGPEGTPGDPWNFSDDTDINTDPGSGNLEFNHADPAQATILSINNINADGSDLSAVIDRINDVANPIKATVTLRQIGASTNFVNCLATGVVTAPGGSYRQISLDQPKTVKGGSFANGANLTVDIHRAGDKGQDGAGGDMFGPGAGTVVDEAAVYQDTTGTRLKRPGSAATRLASGLTAQRPAGVAALLRWSSDLLAWETFHSVWQSLLMSAKKSQPFTGGFKVIPEQIGDSGAFPGNAHSLVIGNGPYQIINNTAAFTLNPPTDEGGMVLGIANNTGAGAVTFPGSWKKELSGGDALTTTVGHEFEISVRNLGGTQYYMIKALQ